MYFTTHLLLTYGLVQVAAAFKLPFYIPWVSATLGEDGQQPLVLPAEEASNRIAIIGAGAGGSSAAFWISKAKASYGLDVEVDVFDSSPYIGGRSITVQPYDDPELDPIELGASIFVKANKNLWRATEEFGFERKDFDEDDTLGIWDGAEFRLMTGYSKVGGWWDSLKVIWRYGWRAPSRTKSLVNGMIDQFVKLYNGSNRSPFESVTILAESYNWTDIASKTTADYFDEHGIDRKWTMEMVEAATRVNYGQNADSIHALEGMCSLAANGASQVKGGNWRIFEEFVKRSNATVYLNTTVASIQQVHDNKYVLRTHTGGSTAETERHYRAVILAAPYHSSSIDVQLAGALAPSIPAQPYVHLHVTLLSTPSPQARPRYFKLKDGAAVPRMVLTTWEGVRADEGARAPEFNSLSYHGKILQRDGTPANITRRGADGSEESGEEWSVKIFSKQKIEDRWLRRVFGEVGWVHRKEWDAYPVLPPTSTFPPIKLAKGLFYVNAFEPFISTMETETISARNVVELLMQEEFNASICASKPSDEVPADYVYGWDC